MSNILYILYVEDNEVEAEILSLCLQRYNINHLILDIAETVEEAKEIFSLEKHAAALIDWNLPDGYGIEVAEHIRLMSKTLPILFLSGHLTKDHLSKAEKYSPRACFEKNYSNEFLEKITDLIC